MSWYDRIENLLRQTAIARGKSVDDVDSTSWYDRIELLLRKLANLSS